MAATDETGPSGVDGGDEAAPGDRASRKAARKLRKAEDVLREAPLEVQSSAEGRGGRAKRQAASAEGAARNELSPEELELRRAFAAKIRKVRAAAGQATQDDSGAVTISPEEMQLRREYGTQLRALRASEAGAVAESVVATPTTATAATVQQTVGAAPPAAPMTPEERKAARRQQKAAEQEAAMPPLPDSWRPPVASGMHGGPAFVGSETAPLAAPVLRPKPRSSYRRACDWLAPRPGIRGALAGVAMFLFWEICRLWGGTVPGMAELLVDILISGVIGVIAWRLLLAQEMRHA